MNDSQLLTRQIMGNVPAWMAVMFYLVAFGCCSLAGTILLRRFWIQRQGRQQRFRQLRERFSGQGFLGILRRMAFHHKLLEDRYAGIAHLLTFYGFVVLFIGTCLVFLEHDTPFHFFYGRFYLVASLIIDLGGLAFLVGLSMYLYRRLFGRSERILRRSFVATLSWLLLAIGVTGFLLEGARIAVDLPEFERWSLVGYSVACGLNTIGIAGDEALQLHRLMWGLHAILCVSFFALLPWGFFSHMVYGPISWALRTGQRRSILPTKPLGSNSLSTAPAPPGASTWQEMEWTDLLQADACTTCGRCNEVCPAHAAGKPLQPRNVVLGLRQAMRDSSSTTKTEPRPLETYVPDPTIWSCTTCGACNEACPVGIEIYQKIVKIRQGRIESGTVPTAASSRFQSTINDSNPFRKPNADRMNWAAGLDVPVAQAGQRIELLYWIGCAGSFDPDGRSVSRAMIKILNHLGISYHVLGKRERCTGDPVRRMGEEGLFQDLAEANLQTMIEHGLPRVITHCPHCFNTFRNEYLQLQEVAFEVEHHSQFLARMIEQGKLKITGAVNKHVTFHDPCYLGRGNAETVAPRQVLNALPTLQQTEMPRNGRNSFCCGAGGGSLWLDIKGNSRIENQRAAEAAATGAKVVVTGCPFCKGMLEAGRQSLDHTAIDVCDLAELIVQSEGL